MVRGARMDGLIRARAEAYGLHFAEVEKQYVSNISLRRMVNADDVALTGLFLASPAGSTSPAKQSASAAT